MPPLEKILSQPVSPDNNSNNPSTSAVRRSIPLHYKNIDNAVSPTRDVIVGTSPLYDFTLIDQPGDDINDNTDNSSSASNNATYRESYWVDLFTYLCVCAPMSGENLNKRPRTSTLSEAAPFKKAAVAARESIIYPVARYPDRLNSPELVHRRRMSLQDQFMFRPVQRE